MTGSAEGWAAQRLGLPAAWYQHIAQSTSLDFRISGDATAIYQDDYNACQQEPPC